MLNILSKALAGFVLDRDARDAMRDAGGLASTIQGSADMRTVIQQLAAARPSIGSSPLTSPSTNRANPLTDPIVMANAAALQAALLAEILTSARATAGAIDRVAPPVAPAPTLSPPQPVRAAAPPVTSPQPTSNSAATLQAAILAQALASARMAVSGGTAPVNYRAPIAPAAPAAPPPSRPARGRRLGPIERAQLIQNALKVHSAKQAILANLSDEQRAKLADLASKLLDPNSGSGEA